MLSYLEEEYPDVFGAGSQPYTPVAYEPEYSQYQSIFTGSTADPMAKSSGYQDLFSPQEFANPYDPSNLIGQMINTSSRRIDGLTAQAEKYRGMESDLDGMAENDWSQVGAGLLGGVAAWLGGGNASEVAGGAYTLGHTYYNNLEAQEKEKKLRIADRIKTTTQQIADETNYNQQLGTAQLSNIANRQAAYQSGQIVGSEPYVQSQQDKIKLARAENDIRDPVVDQRVADKFNTEVGNPAGTPVRKSDITARATMMNTAIRQQNADNAETRMQQSLDDANALVGTKYKEGAAPAPWKIRKAAEIKKRFDPALNSAVKAKEAIQNFGNTLSGADFTILKDTMGRLNNALAIAREAGAAIPKNESAVKLGDVARMFGNGQISNIDAAKAQLRGENFLAGADAMIEALLQDLDLQIGAFDVEVAPDNPFYQSVRQAAQTANPNDPRARLKAKLRNR